ncbi:MAG: alkyl hydroperoxide reductase subunit F [Bdellovibrionales bacterium]
MIDAAMIEQLKTVYAGLEKSIELVYYKSSDTKQAELVQMLEDLAGTSNKISTVELDKNKSVPEFFLKYDGGETGVFFKGIPGGHEFTSLVLAVLNADGKGKMPDEMILNRVKSLKGPIHIKTYISLSCENCPEVVQALNIIALNHPNFTHTMVDGGFVPDEIESLKIQGVPSVIHEDVMLSSGKASFIEVLEKLESKFEKDESLVVEKKDLGKYDVVVIGGGPAGASSAIYSARKGLKTAIIAEKFGGQVQETKGIENMISVTYTEGPELSEQFAKHIAAYDIDLLEHRRVSEVDTASGKKMTLNSGEELSTDQIIIATGAKWRELNIPGEKEYLGRGVAFCPHCDGPYYKGKDIAVIGGGNSGVEAAIDLAGIVKSVTVFEYNDSLKADQVLVDKLNSLDNSKVIVNARTEEVLGDGEKVTGLKYENRESSQMEEIHLDGVFVQIGLIPNSNFIKDIVDTNQYGEILIDDRCRTNIPGIYAAGDVTTVPFKQIVVAMGEGSKAALTAFEDRMIS